MRIQQALKNVSTILSSKSGVASWRSVHIGENELIAYSPEADVRIHLNSKADPIALDVKALSAVIGREKGLITVTRTDAMDFTTTGACEITSGGSVIGKLTGSLPVADLPRYRTIDGTPTTLEIGVCAFAAGLDSVIPAMSSDQTRSSLQGVAVDMETGALVATDGHRMHIASVSGLKLLGSPGQVRTLPANACRVLQKLLRGAKEGNVRLSWDDKTCTVTCADWHVALAWIQGKFPSYEHVIPKEHAIKVKLDGATFRATMERAANLKPAKEKPSVEIVLDVGDCEMGLFAGNPKEGAVVSGKLPCEREGEHIKIAFRPAYILDALDCCYPDDGTITLLFTDPSSPVVFKTLDRMAVVMPVRL